ncbi:hypothetical protein [Streptomyces sp. NPDC020747]|uniref:hypothetical protein n=1 Tax=Streptomyces sp. NPDC020747 TaxID=3365086 RepID=UPI0037ACA2D6
MTVVQAQGGEGGTPRERYARFLAWQAAEAGLGARAIAERFAEEARKQEEDAAAGKSLRYPISGMSYKKSTIDRLLKAEAFPRPPKAFTRQFLRITCKAAGLTQDDFERRYTEACRLLDEIITSQWEEPAQRRPEAPASVPRTEEVARLGGWLVRELRDPFDLGVQRAIDVSGGDGSSTLPVLPVYVERQHDALLREAVLGAVDGRSALVTLIGGSSTGKTRACWEVLRLLPDKWRLRHPIAPSHTDAVLAELPEVGGHTVLWLDEIHHYLLTSDPAVGERVAAGLRELLRTREHGPVLVLATAQPADWARLTAPPSLHDGYPQTRALLTGVGAARGSRIGSSVIPRRLRRRHGPTRVSPRRSPALKPGGLPSTWRACRHSWSAWSTPPRSTGISSSPRCSCAASATARCCPCLDWKPLRLLSPLITCGMNRLTMGGSRAPWSTFPSRAGASPAP